MILQTTTDSDSVKDIDTKAAEIDFLPPLSFVILNEVKNLLREPGGSRIVVVFQILHSAYGCVQDDKNISFRMTGGSCPFSPSSAKIDTLSDYLCALTRGPRTIDFYNVLSFRKIRKCRVRGPLSLPFPPDSSLSLRMTVLYSE